MTVPSRVNLLRLSRYQETRIQPAESGHWAYATTPGGELYGLRNKAQGSYKILFRSESKITGVKRDALSKNASWAWINAGFFASWRKLVNAIPSCG
jgi:hypothetical protein